MIAHIPDKEVRHGRKKKEESSGARPVRCPARETSGETQQKGEKKAPQCDNPLDNPHYSCYCSGGRFSDLEKVRFIE